ncbi:DUF3325 domain-containing protein [Coralloluteibacterium thermophilus]|uniref:DUF3325 domain-containing protein n=1 Tax=Coralloluteibacterium thermophilum TaxID=2707049 RepID=A0ABV9NL28_9GAMM
MHEVLHGWLLAAALLASLAGMGWLALAMPAHAQQVWAAPLPAGARRLLRGLGVAGLVASLLLCLAADHASMAVLVWTMSLAGAALLIAMTLAWRPRWLGLLAPWTGRGRSTACAGT